MEIVVNFCLSANLFLLCENPQGSRLWKLLEDVTNRGGCRLIQFQVALCSWGAKWRKYTTWATNVAELQVSGTCDGQHEHLDFDPEAQAVFSQVFPMKLARHLASVLSSLGAKRQWFRHPLL